MRSPRMFFHILTAWLVGLGFWGSQSPVKCAAGDITVRVNVQTTPEGKKMSVKVVDESPIACNMKALDRKQRQRHRLLTAQLHAALQETRELPDGYSFRLPSDEATIQRTAEWVTLERRCCPFITFAIEIDRERGPLWLRLTGREGVKPFLKMELGIK
jgi:hypothetical protein